MTATVLGHLRALLTASWACDQCGTVNSDSVSSCYKCGA